MPKRILYDLAGRKLPDTEVNRAILRRVRANTSGHCAVEVSGKIVHFLVLDVDPESVLITKQTKDSCKGCHYSKKLSRQESAVYCDYLLMEGKRRPCAAPYYAEDGLCTEHITEEDYECIS